MEEMEQPQWPEAAPEIAAETAPEIAAEAAPETEDPATTETSSRSARSSRQAVIAGVGAAAIGVAAFFGMRAAISPSNAATAPAANVNVNAPPGAAGPGQFGPPPNGRFGRGTFGTIESISGSTLSISTPDGRSVKVTTSSSTTVADMTSSGRQPISLGDLATGDEVMVIGTTGSDGTVVATAIMRGDPMPGPRDGTSNSAVTT